MRKVSWNTLLKMAFGTLDANGWEVTSSIVKAIVREETKDFSDGTISNLEIVVCDGSKNIAMDTIALVKPISFSELSAYLWKNDDVTEILPDDGDSSLTMFLNYHTLIDILEGAY